MKQFILKKVKVVTVVVLALLVGIITTSFQDTPWVSQILDNQKSVDTLPKRNETLTMKDYDKLMEQLSQVTLSLNKIQLEEITKNLDASLEKMDLDGILATVEKSLSEIDLDKILLQVETSLRQADVKIDDKEVQEALKEARKDIEEAKLELKQVDREEIKKELADAREELAESRKEIRMLNLDEIKRQTEIEVNKSLNDLQNQREMFRQLESDGLINTKKGFEINYDQKDLYINGKKQREKVTRKYEKYFKGLPYKIKIDAE